MLQTDRLILRSWKPEDLDPFAALNADPEVMRYYPAPLTRAQSEAFVARANAKIVERGFGLWALEAKATGTFIGYTGLSVADYFNAPFTPCVEIGWRLARGAWGQGYATEAARTALAYGLTICGLNEVLSWTTVGNLRSRRVMERIGMSYDPAEDFEHPDVPEGHPLRPHVLYRIGPR